ncbi:hypothetical protein GlitD10_1203 [Gloeomargarita lithophora Alchichica-D10]|uniref:Uncharacterized protein n=1 Tax=Gloeomargarita lithophora Alchichica-D10 TaxID=1188229 RepID=A0A1J0AC69_9CYAN|nr:hypothetical protein [Gloeomargarita lithophora]APB33523.1 hypothetical protein GlitD10_1203 [Gloeomargarita lithophora Alchichica-D10]
MNSQWITYEPLRFGISLHKHSFENTLANIRNRYLESFSNSCKSQVLVFWLQPPHVGLIVGVKADLIEATWLISDLAKVNLAYAYPAKGGGWVELNLISKNYSQLILSGSSHSLPKLNQAIQWLRPIIGYFVKHLSLEFEEVDTGYNV